MSYNWAPYQSATGCTQYGPAGGKALQVYLEDVFPGQTSFGICNCRRISGSSSYSHHAECRAYDEGFAVFVGQVIGIRTLELLGPHGARLGIDHMIVNHAPQAGTRGDPRIYSARTPQGRTYNGAHPHNNHNHIGLTRNAGRNLTYATLEAVVGPAKEMNVAALQVIELQKTLNKMGAKDYEGKTLAEDDIYGPRTESAWINGMKSGGSGTTDSTARSAAAAAQNLADKAHARLNALRDFRF